MRRDDSSLYALAMLIAVIFALWVSVSSQSMSRNETEPARREIRQEEQVTSDTSGEEAKTPQQEMEMPETQQKVETTPEGEPEAKPDTEPEEQELSPEEIWQQETDYLVGHIYGQMTYDNYGAIKGAHSLLSNTIPDDIYEEYIEATERLLQEAMDNSEISDETMKQYNSAVERISDKEHMKLSQEEIKSMQGFQEAIEYYSYWDVVRDLFFSGGITEEQYGGYCEKISYNENAVTGEAEDITHETVMRRIEYSKQFLKEYGGKEDIPIPYFYEGI